MYMTQEHRERIRIAYKNANKEIKKTLNTLFPEIVDNTMCVKLEAGQVYNWGTDSDGGSAIVVERNSGHFDFVNFRTGETYLEGMRADTTKADLIGRLDRLNSQNPHHLHNCWYGNLVGPRRIKSWCTK
jgi:hypothetical protein